jgi:hypothetical protein
MPLYKNNRREEWCEQCAHFDILITSIKSRPIDIDDIRINAVVLKTLHEDMEKEIKRVNSNIASSLKGFPEFLSSHHLVKLGIFKSIDCIFRARQNGITPKYIKLKHKILYPKCEVISFLEGRMKEAADDKENQ